MCLNKGKVHDDGGVIDFATGLWIAFDSGRCMSQVPNGQASIGVRSQPNISVTEAVLELVAGEFVDFDTSSINLPSQLVFAGSSGQTYELELAVNSLGPGHAVVPGVGAAFHSRYVIEAAECFRSRLEDANIEFHKPRCPIFQRLQQNPFRKTPKG